MDIPETSLLLCRLNNIHRQIGEITSRLQHLKRIDLIGLATFQTTQDKLKSKLESKQELVLLIRKKEREAAFVLDELARREEQLNLARSDREYETIKLQIQIEKNKNEELADLTLELLTNLDVLESEISVVQEEFKKAQELLKKSRTEITAKVLPLQKDYELARKKLQKEELSLSGTLAVMYKHCVERFGGENALAAVVNQSNCGFCNCQLPSNILSKASIGTAVCCSLCGRLLYWS